MTTSALLPPSSRIVRPKRAATELATVRPTCVEPVNEISGTRASCSIGSPTCAEGPITSEASAPKPSASSTGRTTLVSAIAHSGTVPAGFHRQASPQM